MSWRHYCCEVCERNPTCGNDCGSCFDVPPDEIVVVHGPFTPNVELLRASLERHYPGITAPPSSEVKP